MSAAITTRGLVKTFGPTRALDGLDLEVDQGVVHGFLGPNGAGKSTAIRVFLGILRATAGEARILGKDPWHDAVDLHHRLAYVPGDVELWPNLTGGEAIDVLGRLRGGLQDKRRAELIERFDLDPTKKGRTYSKGNRQKVAIIAALSSGADLFLLDEPTAGLDPLMEVVFQDVVRELKSQGKTVLLSSHILAQVERLSDTISIIRRGVIVQSGTLLQMRHLNRTHVEVRTHRPVEDLHTLPGLHDLRREHGAWVFAVDPEHLDATMSHLSGHGIDTLTSNPPTLEELMLRHYGDELSHEHLGEARRA